VQNGRFVAPAVGNEDVTVERVVDRAAMRRFLDLPARIHAGDQAFVPPLRLEREMHLDPRKNPFFQGAEVSYWLARRDGRDVGRISAQVNRVHLARHQDGTGHFGFLDAEDDPLVFRRLLAAAEAWLKEYGLIRICGPFSLSINDESGLLIDGFATPPMVMMGHARPYYAPRLEENGYRKVQDLLAYAYGLDREPSATVTAFIRKAAAHPGVLFRDLDPRRFAEEIARVVAIFNDAWADNWGFLPFSEDEMRYLARSIKPLLAPHDVAIAEIHGTPVAMAVCLPNINEAIADLGGRLWPLGWAKLLWRVKVKGLATARVPLMGVLRRYQATPLGSALAVGVIDRIRASHRARGVRFAELSWILESNRPIRGLIEKIGGHVYKTYRIYGKALT
jgi:hypothetical protein